MQDTDVTSPLVAVKGPSFVKSVTVGKHRLPLPPSEACPPSVSPPPSSDEPPEEPLDELDDAPLEEPLADPPDDPDAAPLLPPLLLVPDFPELEPELLDAGPSYC